MFKKFKTRSRAEEIIDDFDYSGPDLIATFKTIERINSWLGGNRILVDGVRKILHNNTWQMDVPTCVLDLGTGSGDGLRALANWAKNKNIPLDIRGIDANPHIVGLAKVSTPQSLNITYNYANIFDDGFNYQGIDIVTCNLFLHHFSEEEIIEQIQKMQADGVKVLLINDLHRHWIAYYGFWLISLLLRSTKTARVDGLLSVLKGFKRSELLNLAMRSGGKHIEIEWKWAFRFQCIIWFQD